MKLVVKLSSSKYSLRILVCISFVFVISVLDYNKLLHQSFRRTTCVSDYEIHKLSVDGYFLQRKMWRTSNLGTTLFKNIHRDYYDNLRRHDITYMILMWRFWADMEKTRTLDFLEDCHFKNCMFTDDESDIDIADAVVIHMQYSTFPKVTRRNVLQRWILLSEESPIHSYILEAVATVKHMAHLFNWTMNYRSDSDIPIPFGRTAALEAPPDVYFGDPEKALKKLVPYWEEKQMAALLTIMVTDCTKMEILNFLVKLRGYMKVDIHGACLDSDYTKDNLINLGPSDCRNKHDCKVASEYVFYLAIEDVHCRQYFSEKIFYHAYSKGAIPVIGGTPLKDCESLLPPNSFLHLENFKDIPSLTSHLLTVASKFDQMLNLHAWRKHFEVVNEHGYHNSTWPVACRVCEALNINDGEVVTYDTDDLRLFYNKKILCDFKYSLNPQQVSQNKSEPEMVVMETIKDLPQLGLK